MTSLRPSSGETGSHGSPEANPQWESQITRDQALAGQLATTHLRPSSGGIGSHDSPEDNPRWEK
ncbi:hypothetical protein Zm00014a_031259 [Zea mays]|uniref:Uncharacterized protein n=1 Tax=Zea mays TaxID=4577 RepID=A0A3L6DZ37_MAIZE|nr:hypothetical protein Zm00014a_031259 [Zea mays]